jgi:hypothetical protein
MVERLTFQVFAGFPKNGRSGHQIIQPLKPSPTGGGGGVGGPGIILKVIMNAYFYPSTATDLL